MSGPRSTPLIVLSPAYGVGRWHASAGGGRGSRGASCLASTGASGAPAGAGPYRADMLRLRFPMERAFPPDDPVAVFVMTLSIAFGDLRIVGGKYVPREDQPDHERIYFVRVMASHLREIVKVIDRQADAPGIKDFVATLSDEARDARARIPEKLGAHVLKDDERTLLDFLKRLRNDTFHYADDSQSKKRLRDAMAACASNSKEGVYVVGGRATRARYADRIVEEREYPIPGRDHEAGHDHEARIDATRKLHQALLALQDDVATFIKEAEAAYLLEWLPAGIVQVER